MSSDQACLERGEFAPSSMGSAPTNNHHWSTTTADLTLWTNVHEVGNVVRSLQRCTATAGSPWLHNCRLSSTP